MYYLIYLTERCNLQCAYCDAPEAQTERVVDVAYELKDLIAFLQDDEQLGLQFYGGEPLLRTDLLAAILAATSAQHVTLQTNGLLLGQLPEEVFERIDIVCLSVDGDRTVTDRARGDGVYEHVIANARGLRLRGYRGRIDARMTVSPGGQIYDAVMHLLTESAFAFDAVYWQLDVLFYSDAWRRDRRYIGRWFERYYNPQISQLVSAWTRELVDHGRLWNVVPFSALMRDLLTDSRVDHVRCGAGKTMWAITTEGEIYPCPVMRRAPAYSVGTIRDTPVSRGGVRYQLAPPCTSCDILALCGGRCLSANLLKRWGEEGFALVCDSVRHLLAELQRVAPVFRQEIECGRLDLDQLDTGLGYEVIP